MNNNATPVYIIAEAGVNHNGSLQLAKQLIDVAASAGANAVKFQTFKADSLVTRSVRKAGYQKKDTSAEDTQYDMLARLELGSEEHRILANYCRKRGVDFLSSPFDIGSVELLMEICDPPYLKVPSGEITNAPLLLKIAQTGKPVFLSTGMSTLGDIEAALGVLALGYVSTINRPRVRDFYDAYRSTEGQKAIRDKVTLLHCTSEYPAPSDEINLNVINTLRQAFDLPVGYSDHSEGIGIPIAAVAIGAKVIEKHFTLSRDLPGPDHRASLEPCELTIMIENIRHVEIALGSKVKMPGISELKNKDLVRKGIVAACNIKAGDNFDETNLVVKRCGTGISPLYYWDLMGKAADRDYKPDEKVEFPWFPSLF